MVSFVMKLAGIKRKSSESYLVKFKENPLCGFKIIDIFFFKSHVFKNEHVLENFNSITK